MDWTRSTGNSMSGFWAMILRSSINAFSFGGRCPSRSNSRGRNGATSSKPFIGAAPTEEVFEAPLRRIDSLERFASPVDGTDEPHEHDPNASDRPLKIIIEL